MYSRFESVKYFFHIFVHIKKEGHVSDLFSYVRILKAVSLMLHKDLDFLSNLHRYLT